MFKICLFQPIKAHNESDPGSSYESLVNLQPRKELQEYLWPRPPHYHLLWPGRPLPSLPFPKDLGQSPDISEMIAKSQQEPFFGFFFNNNFSMPTSRDNKKPKKDDAISQFMDGPFFR